MKKIIIYILIFLNITLYVYAFTENCYQETANLSNNCILDIPTSQQGNYSIVGSWVLSSSYLWDGSYSTYSYCDINSSAYLYINYTINSGFTLNKWHIATITSPFPNPPLYLNFSIPQSCALTITQLMVNSTWLSPSNNKYLSGYCYNNSEWVTIFSLGPAQNQNVLFDEGMNLNLTINIDNCSNIHGITSNSTISFISKNEDSISQNNFYIEGNVYFSKNRSMLNYTFNGDNLTSKNVCVYPNYNNTYLDIYSKFRTDNGFTNRYYSYNYSIGANENITLYSFDTTTSISTLKLTLRDQSTYQYYPDIVTKLQRYYVGEGVWRTVQYDKSGEFGEAIFNIKEETTDYRLLFTDTENNILDTTSSMKFSCTSALCELTVLLSPYSIITSDNLTTIISYNNNTGIITVSWNDITETTDSIKIVATKETGAGSTSIYEDTIVSPSGSQTINISSYTGTVYVVVSGITDGTEKTNLAKFIEIPTTKIGKYLSKGDQSFYTFCILLTTVGFGLISPTVAVVAMLFGIIVTFFMGILTPLNLTMIMIAIVISIAIGIKMRS